MAHPIKRLGSARLGSARLGSARLGPAAMDVGSPQHHPAVDSALHLHLHVLPGGDIFSCSELQTAAHLVAAVQRAAANPIPETAAGLADWRFTTS